MKPVAFGENPRLGVDFAHPLLACSLHHVVAFEFDPRGPTALGFQTPLHRNFKRLLARVGVSFRQ